MKKYVCLVCIDTIGGQYLVQWGKNNHTEHFIYCIAILRVTLKNKIYNKNWDDLHYEMTLYEKNLR